MWPGCRIVVCTIPFSLLEVVQPRMVLGRCAKGHQRCCITPHNKAGLWDVVRRFFPTSYGLYNVAKLTAAITLVVPFPSGHLCQAVYSKVTTWHLSISRCESMIREKLPERCCLYSHMHIISDQNAHIEDGRRGGGWHGVVHALLNLRIRRSCAFHRMRFLQALVPRECRSLFLTEQIHTCVQIQ